MIVNPFRYLNCNITIVEKKIITATTNSTTCSTIANMLNLRAKIISYWQKGMIVKPFRYLNCNFTAYFTVGTQKVLCIGEANGWRSECPQHKEKTRKELLISLPFASSSFRHTFFVHRIFYTLFLHFSVKSRYTFLIQTTL